MKKIIFLVFILINCIFFVNADSNGIWHFAEDIQGGIFGNDEIVSNYTFQNEVYFESDIFVNFLKDVLDDNFYLNLRDESRFKSLLLSNLSVDGNIGVGINNPETKLDVNGKIKMRFETTDDDSDNIVVTKGYLKSFVLNEIDKIDLSGIGNDENAILYNEIHNGSECLAAGGAVAIAGGVQVCRFEIPSCPSGWIQYLNWSGTEAMTKQVCAQTRNFPGSKANPGSCGCVATKTIGSGYHYWANIGELEIKNTYETIGGTFCTSVPLTLTATWTRVGCY